MNPWTAAARDRDDRYTIAEWRELERRTDRRHDYLAGRVEDVLEMSGGSVPHVKIKGRVRIQIASQLPEECESFESDLAIAVKQGERYRYPDGVVVCGEVDTDEPNDANVATNPILLIEVASKKSYSRDYGDKLYEYRDIPTLRYYLIVEADNFQAVLWSRVEGDAWRSERFHQPGQTIALPSLGVAIDLAALYKGIDLDGEPPRRSPLGVVREGEVPYG